MMRGLAGAWIPVLVAVAVLLLTGIPGAPGPAAGAASPPVGASPTLHVPGAPATTPTSTAPAVPHPTVGCPNTNPPTPAYGTVGGLFPPSPNPLFQTPCNTVWEDEIHASFASSNAYSGERYNVPIWLPPDGSSSTQATAFFEEMLGIVVSGDSSSAWGQSYAEITFTPGTNSWSEDVAVWSMRNDSIYGGSTSESMWACPTNSMAASWNNSFFCVVQMITTTSLGVSVPGGSFLNVTFVGKAGGSGALTVYANDSTNVADSSSYTFSAANTGSSSFEPFYNSSCPDSCRLYWAFPYGEGFGAFPASYSETTLRGMPPLTLGVPKYWTGSGYAGDFAIFAPESTSGVCNQLAPPLTVAPCINFLVNGGTGYYPWFTFNGSQMNFGSDWPWTTFRFGGATAEFLANAAQSDMVPLWFFARSNSSLAGFSPPGSTIYLNATATSFGTVTGVTYRYNLNGGIYYTGALSQTGGSATNATYSASIPSTLGNGLLNYTLTATDAAGSSIVDPPIGFHHIRRGPLPTFTTNITTNAGPCGGVKINGVNYSSGQQFVSHPGFFPIYAVGCYPWNFTQWVPTGGAAVSPTLSDRTETLIVSGNGSLNAVWEYVRPTDTIHVATNPTVCGAVVLDGTPYSNGATVGLLDGLNHTLGASTCGSSLFAGYTFVGNFSILGTVFVPGGNGTLTANFAPSSSAVALQFFTEPSTCGGVLYRGAGYTNGESLSVVPGTYAISGGPCAHFGFLQWQLSGGVSISNNNLTVTSAGSVTEVNYHLTEVTFNLNPSSCGYALFDGVAYHNRQVASVTNNTTHTIYAINNSGCYLIAMTATGGLTLEGNVLVANGSGSVDISFAVGNPSNTIAFLTNPANCGAIWFNNNPYFNANFTSVAPGIVVTIRATPCAGYGFVRWLTFGPISIIGNTAWINSSGAIEAVFTPLVPLFLNTEPATCGAIVFAGQTYPSNSTLLVAEQATYSLGSAPCAGYTLGAWSNSSGLLLTPGFVYVAGGGVLTAVFIPIVYPVLVLTLPSACGSVLVNGVRAFNGTVLRLSAGNYPVTPQPCLGDHLDHWNLTGNLSVAGNSLTVGGPGNLTAVYLPVPPVVVLSVAPSTLVGEEIEIFATIQVPVPPFNYSYAWDFGDGSPVVTTPANFTGHTYHSTGSFTVRVTVTDPYGRVANATAPLSVQPVGATQSVVLTTLQVAAIGAVAAVLLLVFLISYLRTRAARSTESSAGDGASGEGYSPSGTGRKHDKQ